MHVLIRITTLLLLLTVTSPGFAADSNPARQALSDFIVSVDRYVADFEQQLTDETGEILEDTSGKFWLLRPGNFRWHYAEPMERVLVSDGKRIWLYDVDLDQVTVRDAAGAIENTPAGILVGGAEALDNYELSVHEQRNNYMAISLQPKSAQGDFTDILIGLEQNRLVDLRLSDRFGQTTTIRFSNGGIFPDSDFGLFMLDVPDGVDVIDQTTSD